jgi:hypothetical protein
VVVSSSVLAVNATTYNWTLTSVSPVDNSVINATSMFFSNNVSTNMAALVVPSANLRQDITYTIMVTVTNNNQTYTDSTTLKVVYPQTIFSMDDISARTELITLTPNSGVSGE